MVTINGEIVCEEPRSCGVCPFYFNGRTDLCPGSSMGHCRLFDEQHHSWCNVPSRCARLFREAMRFPEGMELVIVKKEQQ